MVSNKIEERRKSKAGIRGKWNISRRKLGDVAVSWGGIGKADDKQDPGSREFGFHTLPDESH